QFQRSDDILALIVVIFIKLIQIDGIKTGGNNDRAVLSGDDLILLCIVNGSGCADLGTDSALSGLEFDTCLRIDNRHVWHCLGKWSVDCGSGIQSAVKFIWSLFGRTL